MRGAWVSCKTTPWSNASNPQPPAHGILISLLIVLCFLPPVSLACISRRNNRTLRGTGATTTPSTWWKWETGPWWWEPWSPSRFLGKPSVQVLHFSLCSLCCCSGFSSADMTLFLSGHELERQHPCFASNHATLESDP